MFIPYALEISATFLPMLPKPMIPIVLPCISDPMRLFFSHLLSCMEWLASGILLIKECIREKVSSAVA